MADQFALARKECELEKTEDVALFALEAYERADKQRTELYYQAKSSNALAAKTLMESLDGAGGERCKALAISSASSKWLHRRRNFASQSNHI